MMQTPVERARIIRSLPAANTLESQPVTLLDQGSPPVFHFQTNPVLQNGQAVFTMVPPSNQIPPACLAQPADSLPNGPVGQFQL